MKCPVCGTRADEEYDYCRRCAWEFEYYFDELSVDERERYKYRLNLYTSIYQKSVLELNDFFNKKNIVVMD